MGDSPLMIVKDKGLSVLYRGYSKTFSKVLVGSALFFPLYDYGKQFFNNPIYASLFSSVVSTTIIHPIDYFKTRHIYGSSLIYDFNLRTYYRGYTLNLARVCPHFVITMTLTEYLQKKR